MHKKFFVVVLTCFCFLLSFSPTYLIAEEVVVEEPVQVKVVESETPVLDSSIPGVPAIPELLDIDDPLQGMNRAVFEFNDFITMWGIRPLSYIWELVVPEYVRVRLGMIDDNIQLPRKLLSNLLRARWEAAGVEFYRFLINTSVGLAGMYDPATDWWGIMARDSSFSATFADWGIGPGIIVFIPIYGGITTTDIFGKVCDLGADPVFWCSLFIIPFPIGISVGGGFTLNSVSLSIEDYLRLREASLDTYIALRNYIYVRRIYEFWQ